MPARSSCPTRRLLEGLRVAAALGFLALASVVGKAERIPATQAPALDGHPVVLPRDLAGRVTVLILGFSRNSADATTAWEKPTRTTLVQAPAIGFYDMPMLAGVPGMMRPLVLRSIRRKVPDVLKPNFVPLTANESDWKRLASYDEHQPDAAYLLLVDSGGSVQWSTHEPYTPARFAAMASEARRLAGQ